MKTILIAHNYSTNSFSCMSVDLAHELATVGNNVVFISHNPHFDNVEIKSIGLGKLTILSWPTNQRPTKLSDFWWFIKLYQKHKPSVIIGHFVGSNITALVSKIMSFGKAKVIVYYHTTSKQIFSDSSRRLFVQDLLNFRKKIFYQIFCDLIICPSLFSQQDLRTTFGIKKSKVIVNPIRDRLKTNLYDGNKTVVYLGRLDNSKGVNELMEGFIKYKDKFPNSQILLRFAGNGSFKNQIADIDKIRDDFNYVGILKYEQVDEYLQNSFYTIIPSKFDNLPTVGIESLMNGTPVLISSNTGLTPYIENGKAGYVFDPTSSAIYDIFCKIDQDNFDYAQLRQNARNLFTSTFTTSQYCSEMLEIIDSL